MMLRPHRGVPRRLAGGALLAATLLVPAGGGAAPRPAAGASFVVIVRADNPAGTLSRAEVARYFLRRSTRWPSGQPVAPVDLPEASPVRAAFTRTVLGRSVAAMRAYWQQQIFSGSDNPPPQQGGDELAVSWVRAHPGAIGYAAPHTALGAGVKAVVLTD